jgi:pimeloyl-ACP methyl ester carboxylesterase
MHHGGVKAPPPPGRLVSLGTHRLHLHCSGAGSPPVVFDAALGGSSLSWTYVQPAVAAFTTACAYDRAGLGWSEAGPLPRTAGRISAELHALLSAANMPPPYVLVGHSFGGLSIRAYASSHPADVAGLVFVDPAHPEDWREPSEGDRERLQRGTALCRRGVVAARLGVAALVARLASAGALELARNIAAAASRRTLHREDEELLAPVTRLPMEVRAVLRWMWTQPRYFEALGSQIEHICASAAEVDLRPDYGSRPLVTISATESSEERRRLQDALARRSSRGRHLAAANSGHWIPIDEPQTVVEAIREVVMAIRTDAGASATS